MNSRISERSCSPPTTPDLIHVLSHITSYHLFFKDLYFIPQNVRLMKKHVVLDPGSYCPISISKVMEMMIEYEQVVKYLLLRRNH